VFKKIFFQIPIIKQIHNRSLDKKARKKVSEAMKEFFVELPKTEEIGNIGEFERSIKEGLAARGLESKGDLKIYKKKIL